VLHWGLSFQHMFYRKHIQIIAAVQTKFIDLIYNKKNVETLAYIFQETHCLEIFQHAALSSSNL
jgi:hypothetical protein